MDNEGNVTQSLGNFVIRAIENRPLAERPKQPLIKKGEVYSDKIILENYPMMCIDTSLKKEKKDRIKDNRKVNIWIDKH